MTQVCGYFSGFIFGLTCVKTSSQEMLFTSGHFAAECAWLPSRDIVRCTGNGSMVLLLGRLPPGPAICPAGSPGGSSNLPSNPPRQLPRGPSNLPSKVPPRLPRDQAIFRATLFPAPATCRDLSPGSVLDTKGILAREVASIVARPKALSRLGVLTHVICRLIPTMFLTLPFGRNGIGSFLAFRFPCPMPPGELLERTVLVRPAPL